MAEDKTTQIKAADLKSREAAPMPSEPVSFGVEKVNREFQEKSTLKKAKDLGLPYVNIGKTPINPDFLKLLDLEVAGKARVIPFFRVGKKLRLAAADPENEEAKKAIAELQNKGFEVNISLCSDAGIVDALQLYEKQQKYKKIEIVESVEEKSIGTYEKEIASLLDLAKKLNTVTAEEGVNLINLGAMKTKASDVHYEPTESTVMVRFRIDGVLHKAFEMPLDTYARISNQIKYVSKMRLNVETVPQDGRYSFVFIF